MRGLVLDPRLLDALTLGGAFYGGGGGGSIALGRQIGRLALEFGSPRLIDVDDVADDAVLVTVSAVGAPAAKGQCVKAFHFVRAVQMLIEQFGVRVSGFITNECGGLAAVNGWIQSAVLGIPVVDAPCNGRAHPTGAMGSMGLTSLDGYVSIQAACGGSEDEGTYIELVTKGSVESAAALVRQSAVQAGGLVAVARNPVEASYVRAHGAPGALRKCIEVGEAMMEALHMRPGESAEAAAATAGGRVVCQGEVVAKELETRGGFDVGRVVLEGDVVLTFWNEYITLEVNDERLATFPDLICTISMESGVPLSSADVRQGDRVAVVVVPREHLILGAGMRERRLFEPVEKAVGKKVIEFVF